MLMALKPPKRQRPLIAIIGINDATETTDYLMPFGILRRSDVADVVLLATEPGPVKLYPALEVEPHATIATFDAQHPEGADYVIVPAMSRDDDPTVLQWLRSQAAKGATIIGVCAGAKVVGAAGLLDGKRATTHWYYLEELLEKHPAIRYVADRRLVVDQGVATTTGITASMPMALTLIEAIAGREKAEAVGRDIGLPHWDARHDSEAFQFTRPFALTAIRNTVAFWNREQLGIELTPGVDEVSLALVADAWSRTYRSRAVTFSRTDGAQQSRNGIRIVPDQVAASWPGERRLPALGDRQPARALDEALRWDYGPLRDAHSRFRRHAARISETTPVGGHSTCGEPLTTSAPGDLSKNLVGPICPMLRRGVATGRLRDFQSSLGAGPIRHYRSPLGARLAQLRVRVGRLRHWLATDGLGKFRPSLSCSVKRPAWIPSPAAGSCRPTSLKARVEGDTQVGPDENALMRRDGRLAQVDRVPLAPGRPDRRCRRGSGRRRRQKRMSSMRP